MAIRDWSQTAASNTTLEGINVAEGQFVISNFNDVLRALTAALREVQATSSVASAATVNIGAANAEYLDVTGTTTITAFDSVAAGVYRVLRFAGILTLTHNATSLILPTGASITTAAGDLAAFRSLGSGNWRCEWYTRADGTALGSSVATAAEIKTAINNTKTVTPAGLANAVGGAWVSVASAATVDLGAQTVANVQITGTTTITAFGTTDSGVTRQLRFSGALTLTHNATSLILPGAASITTAANDVATAISLGSGNWVVTNYERASGRAITGLTLTAGTTLTLDPYALNTTTTQAHGLGVRPRLFDCYLECKTSELGYTAGQILPMPTLHVQGNNPGTIWNCTADATNTVLITSSTLLPVVVRADTRTATTPITAANWRVLIVPYSVA